MKEHFSENQVDHFLDLINSAANAEEVICQLAMSGKKNANAAASKLLARRDEDGAIWSFDQIDAIAQDHPKFFNAALHEARHPFLVSSGTGILANSSFSIAKTVGFWFAINWGKWPKKWGDPRNEFARLLFNKRRDLQDKLDTEDNNIKHAKRHLEQAKKDHPNDPDHREISDAKIALESANARKKEVEREVKALQDARAKLDHKATWKIVKANIKAKLAELRALRKTITGNDIKSKKKRAKIDVEIISAEGDIYDGEEALAKIK
ncbi:hypothetical protein [Maritalea porphyrae]|uniref:Uncharacterized protein n=1 Tax=Maritalea porphyrae TaxID=880732 RepID=A0ABQ5ULG8_9HYPH|nr:hypothetical protein [Maritalea porphyrae]GLQ15886.1 hypothetical protein GCM10007879_01350 [Maritalea porphyrae]